MDVSRNSEPTVAEPSSQVTKDWTFLGRPGKSKERTEQGAGQAGPSTVAESTPLRYE